MTSGLLIAALIFGGRSAWNFYVYYAAHARGQFVFIEQSFLDYFAIPGMIPCAMVWSATGGSSISSWLAFATGVIFVYGGLGMTIDLYRCRSAAVRSAALSRPSK
jgi:hypothetical protein